MAASFKSVDGVTVKDGAHVTLVLFKGSEETLPKSDYSERELTGTVRSYEHVDRVLDDEGYAVDKIVTLVWEISTDDPSYPAVGFLPESVLTATET